MHLMRAILKLLEKSARSDYMQLLITFEHTAKTAHLPHHNDLFDRILITQSDKKIKNMMCLCCLFDNLDLRIFGMLSCLSLESWKF